MSAEGAEKRDWLCWEGGTEEVLKDLKEGEELRRLGRDVRVEISGNGHGMLQSIVE